MSLSPVGSHLVLSPNLVRPLTGLTMRSVASLSCRTQYPCQEQMEPCTNESSATIARIWGITRAHAHKRTKTKKEGVQMLQVVPETTVEAVEDQYLNEFTFLNVQEKSDRFLFHQSKTRYDIIPSLRILLDSQSIVSVFKNRLLLSNIRPSASNLHVHTNGGVQISSQMGTVKNFGDVWFNTDSLANILLMAAVRKVCRITMDTSVEATMNVHRKDDTIMKFKEYKSGLYYYDTGGHKTTRERYTERLGTHPRKISTRFWKTI
jgi:hypothetical protein